MAAATIVLTDKREHVETDGRRSVEATVTFSTPGTDTYTTGGIPVPMLALGLRTLNKVYEIKTNAGLFTFGEWGVSQGTTTNSVYFDTIFGGTPEAPKMIIFVAGVAHTGALPASWKYRLRFVGTA